MGEVVVAFQLLKELPHSRRLDIKTADGIRPADLSGDDGIGFKPFDIVDVDVDPFVLPDQLHGVFDMAQAPLAEDIQFKKPDLLGDEHIDGRLNQDLQLRYMFIG